MISTVNSASQGNISQVEKTSKTFRSISIQDIRDESATDCKDSFGTKANYDSSSKWEKLRPGVWRVSSIAVKDEETKEVIEPVAPKNECYEAHSPPKVSLAFNDADEVVVVVAEEEVCESMIAPQYTTESHRPAWNDSTVIKTDVNMAQEDGAVLSKMAVTQTENSAPTSFSQSMLREASKSKLLTKDLKIAVLYPFNEEKSDVAESRTTQIEITPHDSDVICNIEVVNMFMDNLLFIAGEPVRKAKVSRKEKKRIKKDESKMKRAIAQLTTTDLLIVAAIDDQSEVVKSFLNHYGRYLWDFAVNKQKPVALLFVSRECSKYFESPREAFGDWIQKLRSVFNDNKMDFPYLCIRHPTVLSKNTENVPELGPQDVSVWLKCAHFIDQIGKVDKKMRIKNDTLIRGLSLEISKRCEKTCLADMPDQTVIACVPDGFFDPRLKLILTYPDCGPARICKRLTVKPFLITENTENQTQLDMLQSLFKKGTESGIVIFCDSTQSKQMERVNHFVEWCLSRLSVEFRCITIVADRASHLNGKGAKAFLSKDQVDWVEVAFPHNRCSLAYFWNVVYWMID